MTHYVDYPFSLRIKNIVLQLNTKKLYFFRKSGFSWRWYSMLRYCLKIFILLTTSVGGVFFPLFRLRACHATCFDQWAVGRSDVSKSLKCVSAITFLCLCDSHKKRFLCVSLCPRIKTSGANQSQAYSSKQSHPAEPRSANYHQQADP